MWRFKFLLNLIVILVVTGCTPSSIEPVAVSSIAPIPKKVDCYKAADEFLRWNKIKKKTSIGLTTRRKKEYALFVRACTHE